MKPLEKLILDASCGGRMFWFNKKHPHVLYVDIRKEEKGFMKLRPNFEVAPDEIQDYTNLPYPDKSFKMVVWDPPHTIRPGTGKPGYIALRYGRLLPEEWEKNLYLGFRECWRVLEDYGVLIFKWNSKEKKIVDILKLFSEPPLFGHTTNNKGNTHWLCFMKIPTLVL